jgi:outer membrane putative beta-barrel porin/alpha-amylase
VIRVLARHVWLAALAVALSVQGVQAQDLEPRAYSSSPIGTTFLVAGLGRSSGDVIFDPSIPLTDVNAELYAFTVGLGRTFALADRLAQLSAAVPYSWGEVEGSVGERTGRVTRSGAADMRVRLSVNLLGAPAMTPREFAGRKRRDTVVGASLTVSAPIGEYDQTKLINLGTNRWAFKPEIGVSHPAGRWDLEAYGGAWFFTENPTFFPGHVRRSQNFIGGVQGHVSYTLRPRAWVAGDLTWYAGGATSVDDGPATARQNNTRYGVTFAWPLGQRQSIKASYAAGAIVRSGADFRTFAVTWQVFWIDRPRP